MVTADRLVLHAKLLLTRSYADYSARFKQLSLRASNVKSSVPCRKELFYRPNKAGVLRDNKYS